MVVVPNIRSNKNKLSLVLDAEYSLYSLSIKLNFYFVISLKVKIRTIIYTILIVLINVFYIF
ncbi:MAG: hypothetical protein RLZZ148_520 [Cyanobacteriota bacterium]|jgi:hypothetical protein